MSGETDLSGIESLAQGGKEEEVRGAQGRGSGPGLGPSTSDQSRPSVANGGPSKSQHRRKTSISSLVASLFSVPPQKKLPGMTGGIYAVDGVDVDDEGRVMGMDPKYWIKDIDTGNVYSLEDNRGLDERGYGRQGDRRRPRPRLPRLVHRRVRPERLRSRPGRYPGRFISRPPRERRDGWGRWSRASRGPRRRAFCRRRARPAPASEAAGAHGSRSKESGVIRVSDVFTAEARGPQYSPRKRVGT